MTAWREKEKDLREEAIISAAEKLFFGRGFERTSMDDVALEAGFTKRTVYQYFSSKQDLSYAVILRGMRRLLQRVRDAGAGMDGIEKLKQKKIAAWRCARENPEMFGVMSQIRLIRSGGENSVYERSIADLSAELYAVFGEVLNECRKTGAIPPAKDALEQGASFFIFIGTLARLADVGDAYAAQFGADAESFALAVLSLTDRLVMPWNASRI